MTRLTTRQWVGSWIYHRLVKPFGRASGIARALGRIIIDDQKDLREFWRQPNPRANHPMHYTEPIARSEALLSILNGRLEVEDPILELGCNVGRNLAFLHDNGFRNLSGIEINPHAVKLLREIYPQLTDATIHVDSAEDILPILPRRAFQLTYTMAVLQHIHPSASRGVFRGISRVSHHVLAIEPTFGRASHREYPYDIEAEFNRVGMKCVESVPMRKIVDLDRDRGLENYIARWFIHS